MSVPPAPEPTENPQQPPATAPQSLRGQWKIGVALLVIACVAQGILWARTWEDPTNFKMSVLFVWPAALFSLLIWWTFFSGWSSKVRYLSVAAGFACVVAFFSLFRLERFDGDMTPTRISFRWAPDSDQKLRQYLDQLKTTAPKSAETTGTTKAEPLTANPDDWPGYRGPSRDGILSGATLRTDWSTRPPKELWRHPVGRGWSSFAVVGDFAFTQEQRDQDQSLDSEAVVAYSLSDGRQLWVHMDKARFAASDAQGGTGPRSTPQFHEGKLYTLGATGILNCLDARTGRRVWFTNILEDAGTPDQPAANLPWGMAGSPLIVGQLVIVIPGGGKQNLVAAYDRESGKKVWSGGDGPATYASPSVGTLLGEQVLFAPAGTGLSAHSLDDGKQLWFFEWSNNSQVCGALPVVLDEQSVLFGIGYGIGTVRLNLTRGDSWSVSQTWHSNRFRPKFNDFVVRDGHAYGLDDGTLTCLNVESGKVVWKSGRYGYGQLLLVGDVLLIVSEKGEVFQVPAQPTRPGELAGFQALDAEGITWNQPALVRGKLLVRNSQEAACFDLE